MGFIIPNFLPTFVTIIAALAIFQAWILVGVCIGELLIDLGVRNFVDTKLHGHFACWCLAGCLFLCITVAD
jgi:hypothetical protein